MLILIIVKWYIRYSIIVKYIIIYYTVNYIIIIVYELLNVIWAEIICI